MLVRLLLLLLNIPTLSAVIWKQLKPTIVACNHPSILHKLVPLSSICSDTHNENSTWSVSVKTGPAAVTNHGTFSELAIGCLENNLGLVHVNHLIAAYIYNTKRIWQMPEALSLEYISWFTSLSSKCRRLLSGQANTMFHLGNLAFIVPLSSCLIHKSNLLKSCSMREAMDIQR